MGLRARERCMTWKDDLQSEIERRWTIGSTFTLDEVYEFEQNFSARYPENNTVRDSLRRNLQELRDDGMLEFIDDRGLYRRAR